MHGNTQTTSSGMKTRKFEDIRSEVELAFDIHSAAGQTLGGVHIELTGENVTECIGGARGQNEEDLARAYESEVDPRLNYEQSLELAFLIARKMKNGNSSVGARHAGRKKSGRADRDPGLLLVAAKPSSE